MCEVLRLEKKKKAAGFFKGKKVSKQVIKAKKRKEALKAKNIYKHY